VGPNDPPEALGFTDRGGRGDELVVSFLVEDNGSGLLGRAAKSGGVPRLVTDNRGFPTAGGEGSRGVESNFAETVTSHPRGEGGLSVTGLGETGPDNLLESVPDRPIEGIGLILPNFEGGGPHEVSGPNHPEGAAEEKHGGLYVVERGQLGERADWRRGRRRDPMNSAEKAAEPRGTPRMETWVRGVTGTPAGRHPVLGMGSGSR